MLKILLSVLLTLIATIPVYSQVDECVLYTAKDGDMIKVHAELLAEMRIQPTTCPQDTEYSIIMMWENNYSNWDTRITKSLSDYFRMRDYNRSPEESILPAKRDKVFLEFERMIKETIPDTEKHKCLHCPKYENIMAEFVGMLLILPYPENLKPSGFNMVDGIGLVRFTTRYWLVLTSILSIEAEEFGNVDHSIEEQAEGISLMLSGIPTGRIIRVDSQTVTEQESD